MKIFLAGASGVIGRSLVPRLTGAGHDVTGTTGDAATTGLVRSLGAQPAVVVKFQGANGLRVGTGLSQLA